MPLVASSGRTARRTMLLFALASLVACTRSTQTPHVWLTPIRVVVRTPLPVPVQTLLPLDIPRAFCRPWGDYDPHHGVWNYAVTQIGNLGVPKLTAEELAQIRAVRRKDTYRYLRFALLPSEGLVVFDATQGVCSPYAVGYPVLNWPANSNSYYQPGENPYHTHAGPPY